MTDKNETVKGNTDQLARRSFVKKAAVAAAFAAPILESMTKSDLLVKSAQAQTYRSFVVGVLPTPTPTATPPP